MHVDVTWEVMVHTTNRNPLQASVKLSFLVKPNFSFD